MAHDRVTVNILTAPSSRFRSSGNPYDAFRGDIGVVIDARTLRRPNVAVYCPPFDESAYQTDRPRLVVEILSRSTQHVDQFVELGEYYSLAAIDPILLVCPYQVEVGAWSRGVGGAWQNIVLEEIDASIELPQLAVSLPIQSIYERVALQSHPRPRLVSPAPT